jgi:hypothetical protein
VIMYGIIPYHAARAIFNQRLADGKFALMRCLSENRYIVFRTTDEAMAGTVPTYRNGYE